MISENALVIYKNKPALVKDISDGKLTIFIQNGGQIKVREKDVELIHPGPVKDFNQIEGGAAASSGSSTAHEAVREAWELLIDDSAAVSLKDLAGLIGGGYTPASAYAAYCALKDGLYFTGSAAAIILRTKDEVAAGEAKRDEKQKETDGRSAFLARLKASLKNKEQGLLEGDERFLQDVEALAYGKSAKSRTMKELGLSETPEDAHSLLLNTGIWTVAVNPHPSRFGLPLTQPCGVLTADALAASALAASALAASALAAEALAAEALAAEALAAEALAALPEPEPPNSGSICPPERRDLSHLEAFAIDSPWSTDPDDAVSIEPADGQALTGSRQMQTETAALPPRRDLYVHVADPASLIASGSPADKEARNRGATLYLPENTVRMLPEESLPIFALGLAEKSPALTFKMTLGEDGEIIDTDIFPSIVKVKRISYEEADNIINDCSLQDAPAAALRALMDAAERNLKRRLAAGAVNIELPEARVSVNDGEVCVEPVKAYRSASLVRECMLIAGEGAGTWASEKGLAFPYISQEVEITEKVLPGFAGSYQLRRCMRPRSLLTKPGRHWGLGLETYTQVTSPLRRYTDLLAHIQIRSYIAGKPLSVDEISAQLGAGEAAAAAVTQAERASRNHWLMVYLSDKKDTKWDAVVLEKKGSRWALIIPALALETQVPLQKNVLPNDNVELILKSVNISRGEAVFVGL